MCLDSIWCVPAELAFDNPHTCCTIDEAIQMFKWKITGQTSRQIIGHWFHFSIKKRAMSKFRTSEAILHTKICQFLLPETTQSVYQCHRVTCISFRLFAVQTIYPKSWFVLFDMQACLFQRRRPPSLILSFLSHVKPQMQLKIVWSSLSCECVPSTQQCSTIWGLNLVSFELKRCELLRRKQLGDSF